MACKFLYSTSPCSQSSSSLTNLLEINLQVDYISSPSKFVSVPSRIKTELITRAKLSSGFEQEKSINYPHKNPRKLHRESPRKDAKFVTRVSQESSVPSENAGSSDFKKPGSRRRRIKNNEGTSSSKRGFNDNDNDNNNNNDNDVNSNADNENGDSIVKEDDITFGNDQQEMYKESDYIIEEPKKEEKLSPYEHAKKYGEPHSFTPPDAEKIESLPREKLWWNRRENPDEIWTKRNRRLSTADWVMAKAMAETGQIKLFGENPTITECNLALARKKALKEERLQAEEDRKFEIGALAYYKEWVKAWDRDTSKEAVQKHFEETGEDEHLQLMDMLSYQTEEEYRIMMGTDIRIRRDPLVMRMRSELKLEAYGGDPVYPSVNYYQDPDHIIDFRGPTYHEPTKSPLQYFREKGLVITEKELLQMQEEDEEDFEPTEDYRMVQAVDIGEDEEEEGDDADDVLPFEDEDDEDDEETKDLS